VSASLTGRDLVRRTLEFDAPPRVPRQMWVLPWATERHPERVHRIQRRFPDDLLSAPPAYRTPPRVTGDRHAPGTYVDEWGCVFTNVQAGVIGEVKSPPLTDWDRVDEIRVPVERLTLDTDEVNAFCRATDRFVIAGVFPRPFEQLQFIRGSESLYLDLLERPPGLADLVARMHAFYLDELEVWAGTEVDALMLMDDWGAQSAMLVDPRLWREMFRPLYRDYIELAHRHGKPMFMHSDGYILDILPDLIDLGLDALNCQVFCMDVERLGERFGGRITFWGEMDRQRILPHGTPEEVVAATERMRRAFDRGGGVIAQCEFGPGADPDNVEAFFAAW
jgi:hypothetical protein